MATNLDNRIARVTADRTSGASELLVEVVQLLTEALREGLDLGPIARRLLRGQPSMAPVWNLVGEALASVGDLARFARYSAQLARAPQTLARHASALLRMDSGSDALRVVTISYSGTVLLTLRGLAADRLQVACADGQPLLEGRRMAQSLAAEGIPVTHYADAGLAQALDGADAVIVGADAVSPDWFLNKSGTRMLAAAAAQRGVPLYVCATREKFVSRAIAGLLTVRDESPSEIWSAPPPGVTVRNRYFEATPLDLVSAVISDIGVLGAALVPDACHSRHEGLLRDLQDRPT